MRRLIIIFVMAAQGCVYDGSSTAAPPEGESGGDGADGGPTAVCAGFTSEPCGECGVEVCIPDGTSARVVCTSAPEERPCGGDLRCTSSAQCEPVQTECEYMDGTNYRMCGECGREFCLADGTWSGLCDAHDPFCDDGKSCVQVETAVFECVTPAATCETTGFMEACGEGEPVDIVVSAGTSWITSEGCNPADIELGFCRECTCVDLGGGQAEVQCDVLCTVPASDS